MLLFPGVEGDLFMPSGRRDERTSGTILHGAPTMPVFVRIAIALHGRCAAARRFGFTVMRASPCLVPSIVATVEERAEPGRMYEVR